MIVYKVVTKKGRGSAVVSNSFPYTIAYSDVPDTIIEALPNTMGIFCFSTKAYAKRFIYSMYGEDRLTIIKVEGIGKPFRPKNIVCMPCMSSLDRFYKYRKNHKSVSRLSHKSPEGTICFQSIKIL